MRERTHSSCSAPNRARRASMADHRRCRAFENFSAADDICGRLTAPAAISDASVVSTTADISARRRSLAPAESALQACFSAARMSIGCRGRTHALRKCASSPSRRAAPAPSAISASGTRESRPRSPEAVQVGETVPCWVPLAQTSHRQKAAFCDFILTGQRVEISRSLGAAGREARRSTPGRSRGLGSYFLGENRVAR